MVEHFGLDEVWLPAAEVAQATSAPQTPSKSAPGKRVRFGSKALPRLSYNSSGEDDKLSEDGESRSDESETAISWRSAPRSGVFTIDEQDLSRVTAEAMIKHARCNIFLSKNFWTCERLLVLLQGSGAVRPGQWSRSLCITQSIRAGSVFDYLQLAAETNVGVIILNPNHNQIKLRIRAIDTPGSGTMSIHHAYDIKGHDTHLSHIMSVYDQYIGPCKAKEIFVVANGRGGDTLLQLLNKRLDSPLNLPPMAGLPAHSALTEAQNRTSPLSTRIRAIAFVNSAHSVSYANNDRVKQLIEERSVHWVLSPLPLDTSVPEQADNFGCTCVSSGHLKADFAPACCVNSVFEFFCGRVATPRDPQPDWTPVTIPFSNPPQNMPARFIEDTGEESENDSELSEGETRQSSSSERYSSSPNLIDPPLPLSSGKGSVNPNGMAAHRQNGHHHSQSEDLTFSVRDRPGATFGQEIDHSMLRSTMPPEMIEAGTQTDPIHRTPLNILPSSARPFVATHTGPLECLSLCPFCRLSGWISTSGIRSIVSFVLVAAGMYATRLYLLHKRSLDRSQRH